MRSFSKTSILLCLFFLLVFITTYALEEDIKPKNIRVVSLTDSSISFEWEPATDDSVKGYQLYKYDIQNTESNPILTIDGKSSTSCSYDFAEHLFDDNNTLYLKIGSINTNNMYISGSMSDLFTIITDSCSAVPSTNEVMVGDTVQYAVYFKNLHDAISASFTLDYDPLVVQPVDTSGSPISPGDLFANGLTVVNWDAENGSILFSISQQENIQPYNGDGILGYIDFKALNEGEPNIQLSNTKYVSAVDGDIHQLAYHYLIPSQQQFSIIPQPNTIAVNVAAKLQYKNALDGIKIIVTNANNEIVTISDMVVENLVQVTLLPGTYTLKATAPGHLDLAKTNITIDETSAQIDLGTLIAGDANNDNQIDEQDLAILRNEYLNKVSTTDSDFNGDGIVDLIDLTILGINYHKTGN